MESQFGNCMVWESQCGSVGVTEYFIHGTKQIQSVGVLEIESCRSYYVWESKCVGVAV